MINILVTGVGSLLGQGIIKTIKKSDIKSNIFGTDYFEAAVGLYWVKKGYLLPDVLKKNNFESWLKKFIYICRKEKIDIIIPGLDFETPILSKYKKIIEKKTKSRILVSSIDVIKICNDKWETNKFLKKNNFLYPKSCLPNHVNAFLKNNKFPLIVKPRFGSTSKNIALVKNISELKKALINCKKPIIQEIIGKKNNEYTCGSTLINGKVLSTITLKRQLKDGNTKIAFHNKNINLNDFLCEVTKKLNPYGPINIQLILTKNGPVIFEINPRFSGTTPIRAMFGLNEINLILREIYKLKFKKNKIKYGTIIRYFEEFYISDKDLIK